MDVRSNVNTEYFKKALACIKDNKLDDFKKLLELEDDVCEKRSCPVFEPSWFYFGDYSCYEMRHCGGFEDKWTDVKKPILYQCRNRLLMEAIRCRNIDFIKCLLRHQYDDLECTTTSHPLTFTNVKNPFITLTPELFNKAMSKFGSSIEALPFNDETSLLNLVVKDLIPAIRKYSSDEVEILKWLFTGFINDNFNNVDWKKPDWQNSDFINCFIHHFKKFYPSPIIELNDIFDYFIKKIFFNNRGEYSGKISDFFEFQSQAFVFEKVLSEFSRSAEILSDCLITKYGSWSEYSIPDSGAMEFANANNDLMKNIGDLLVYVKDKGLTLYQSDRIHVIGKLVQDAVTVNNTDVSSIEKCARLLLLLENARNQIQASVNKSIICSKSTTMDGIDKLISTTFENHPVIRSCFRLNHNTICIYNLNFFLDLKSRHNKDLTQTVSGNVLKKS